VGPNPSYLTFDPSHKFLYVVNELKEFEGEATGTVSAFSVNRVSGSLKFINSQPSNGTDPCHLTVDGTGRYVLVANFMSGSVCVLPIQERGSLGPPTDVVQHRGSSVDPVRQKGPHAHAVTLDNNGLFTFVPDLGLDKVMIYEFNQNNGKLEPHDPAWIDVPPGAGPRKLVLHKNGRFAYLINELNSTVVAFQYDRDNGSLGKFQISSTLPDDFDKENTCAEIQISPSGKFLYGSNRGHDSIVTFAIDQKDGSLSCIGHTSTLGQSPRHFIIDPPGEFLLVANQDSNSVITFRLDSNSGEPIDTGCYTNVPTPVCIKFL
jgi:6-phosphogluconolactonase